MEQLKRVSIHRASSARYRDSIVYLSLSASTKEPRMYTLDTVDFLCLWRRLPPPQAPDSGISRLLTGNYLQYTFPISLESALSPWARSLPTFTIVQSCFVKAKLSCGGVSWSNTNVAEA